MPKPAPKLSPTEMIQQEVIGNILSQRLGDGTVADLNLPREFVARIADRVTRASFNERHRIVVEVPNGGHRASFGSGAPTAQFTPPARPAAHATASEREEHGGREESRPTRLPHVHIVDLPLSAEALRVRRGLHEARPANRAFRAGDDPTTMDQPAPLPPTDLARFQPTISNFQILADDGTHRPKLLRLQLTRGTDYAAPGDGGSLDMLRGIASELPEMPLLVSVERRHLGDARAACEEFARARGASITLIVEDLPVAQWAHDNGKPGVAGGESVTLVPRYASRGEDGSVLVAGESFIHDGLMAAGVPCRRSPLLFQGGNMIAFHAPSRPRPGAGVAPRASTVDAGGREGLTLLLGEGEVARNTAMGLTREGVVAAFQAEFGVARVVVLPAVSYHIDLELSVRCLGEGEVIALVNDQPAAARQVVALGLEALGRGGVITEARRAFLRERLNRGPMNEFLVGTWSDLARFSTRPGHVHESLAPVFSVGAADSGVGNIHRYLLALDLLASEVPMTTRIDPHAAAVLGSYARRELERRQLRQQLKTLGLKVAGIPSLSDGGRGINYLNGIHTDDAFMMPKYGGLFSALDHDAARAVGEAMGANVRIVGISSGESQRREGAVRCAVGVAG